MEEESSWLPAGWKVEARVRRSGKKDKFYTDPSNEHKFHSKLEVLRYLKSAEVENEGPTKKSSKNPSAKKFVVKEAVAEGLPAGWIKEIRVTKKGNKIRRDPLLCNITFGDFACMDIFMHLPTFYYIDPVTGHLFRSMREVSRYLHAGKMPKHSSKPKEQEPIKSPETVKERSANDIAQKPDAENPNHNAVEESPATDHVNQLKIDNSEQKENTEKSSESKSSVVEDPQEKLQPEKEGKVHETECNSKKKLKKKRGAELPRRTSKRLAGISVELPPEQKEHNRVHQIGATFMVQEEAKCADNCEDSKDSDEHVERTKTGNDTDKKQENLDASSSGDNIALQEEHAQKGVVECKIDEKQECKVDEKQEAPTDSLLKDLWKDPCIEFAIKTLTGAIPIVDEHQVSQDPLRSVDLPNAVPGDQDLPLGDIWADPCIEFAVKTLTGDVPIGNDIDVQDVDQQPHYTSSFGGEKGMLPSSSWSNERSRASASFTHTDVSQKQL